MKTSVKHLVSLIALLLCTVMLLSACGGKEPTSSVDSAASEVESVAETNSDTAEAEESSSKKSDTASASSKKQQTTTAKKTTWDANYLESIPDSVVSKGIHVLMWREYTAMEKKLVEDFEKKTGMKVRTTVTTEKEYSTKLISLIGAKDSPDVVSLGVRSFPGRVVKALQPLNATTFRLDDSCWKKSAMDAFSVNGKYYSVAMPGSWSCEDTAYVTYYSPAVLKQCGIGKTPYQHYKEGTWNWDTQYEMAMQVKNTNPNFVPISLQSRDLYMYSAGEDFVSYDGKQFTNKLANPSDLFAKAWQELCKIRENGLQNDWDLVNVQQGKCALFTGILFGMYNEGQWFDNVQGGAASLEAVPVAGPKGGTAYTPTRVKTWGVSKGAKNAEGAAYFLRYFLDTNNCDMAGSFYNSQFKEVFDIVTAPTAKQKIMYGDGVTDYTAESTYIQICNQISLSTAANVNTVFASYVGKINAPVKRANTDLKKIK